MNSPALQSGSLMVGTARFFSVVQASQLHGFLTGLSGRQAVFYCGECCGFKHHKGQHYVFFV